MTGTIAHEPEASYFRRELDVASNSGLKIIDSQSPALYRYWCEHPEDDADTPALAFGHAFHCASLEPDLFDSRYIVLPDNSPRRPTQAQWNAKKPSPESIASMDFWSRWNAQAAGRVLLPSADYDAARKMGDRVRSQVFHLAGIKVTGEELIGQCQKEVTLRWTDERTGIKCKSRVDLHCPELGFQGDFKSTICAAPEAFARSVHTYRYHQQGAHYLGGSVAVGETCTTFLMFPCEKSAPFEPAVYELPYMALERGLELRNRALDKLKRCLESGEWHGYTPKVAPVILPSYAYFDAEPTGATP